MKLYLLFVVLSILSSSQAQDCNNPLLDVFGITGLPTPQSGQGLPFCPNLQNGQTCCSSETLLGLQLNLNNLIQRLQAQTASKDIYIAQLNSNFSSDYQDTMSDFSDYSSDIDDLQKNVPEVGQPIKAQTDLFKNIADALDDIDDDSFPETFIPYQEKRKACLTTLLQIQASAWCLACDPNYASLGVQPDGTVTQDPNVCATIQNACAPFLDQAVKLNSLFQAQQTYPRLLNIKGYLDAYEDNGKNIPNITIDNDIPALTNATERTVSQPEGCNNDNCEWQCSNLFSPQLVLNEEIAANGAGVIGGADITLPPIGLVLLPVTPETEQGTPIEEAEVTEVITEVTETIVTETITEQVTTPTTGNGRLLQETTGWNPDVQATGFEIDFAQDPGNVTNWDEGGASDLSDADIDDHLAGLRMSITNSIFVPVLIVAAVL